ncbi:hypothetical protein EWM62_11215 [Mucilaginibacter terrigena]|uniref:Uncharacterized protein n=1 Tax=Mucilaginibacter terrigena TaxID=2492395 RepID=A0A4Q5LK86_9SPHI|nr:hypothetical protein [Mucilaginibacter terrigena]RYU90104.1 hypothetical protein EWM62_11215 [Mucilaginibacter terrigena]
MKNLFMIVIVAFTFTVKASAQTYEVPKDYHFNKQEDYVKYEPDIIKTADWMMKTAWGTEPLKTEAATQFLLIWAQGTPDVVIELKQAIMDLSDANPQLGFIYMSQFSKYAIQHKADFDKTKANMAALRAVITKYNIEPTHKRDNDVERLMDLDKNNRLETWISNEFAFN